VCAHRTGNGREPNRNDGNLLQEPFLHLADFIGLRDRIEEPELVLFGSSVIWIELRRFSRDESRVIRPGHWERAQISEMGIIGS